MQLQSCINDVFRSLILLKPRQSCSYVWRPVLACALMMYIVSSI